MRTHSVGGLIERDPLALTKGAWLLRLRSPERAPGRHEAGADQ